MTTKYVKKKWTVIAKFKIHYIKVCDTYIFEFPATVGCKRPLFHIHEVSPQCPVLPVFKFFRVLCISKVPICEEAAIRFL